MIGGGMSTTSVEYANVYAFTYCKRCGLDKFECVCWIDLMQGLDRILYLTSKLDIYKCPKIITKCIKTINFIRRTPMCISGMKGLALLKNLNKR